MASSKNNAPKVFVSCLQCAHGHFMQWFANPIVAYCDERHERMVACSQRICSDFKESRNPKPEITHFDHYELGQADYIEKQAEANLSK